jgi:hypothetical protein
MATEYTHTTLSDLRTQLAGRLGDPSNTHWVSAELDLNIADTLCRWALYTGFYRVRATFPTTNNVALYDLASQSALADYLSRSRTDRDELGLMQYMLREPFDPIDGTGMSDQFTFAQLVAALQRARDQFRSDLLSPLSSVPLIVDPDSDPPTLPDNVIAIRRAIWLSVDGARSNVHRSDEHEALAYNTTYTLDSGTPELYSLIGSPQLTIRLIPPPVDIGTLELVVATTGPQLDPATPTALDIPDDCAWIVRSLALSDLLSRDGPAYDPSRAEYLRAEYQLGVQLATQAVVLLDAELDGVPVMPSALADIDFAYSSPHWQSAATGSPTDLGVLGDDLIALRPVPDSNSYSVLVDIVRKAPLPTADDSYIQVPREDLGAILDGAESLCLFKLGGESVGDMRKLSESMFRAAMRYNSRLSIDGYAHTMSRSAKLDEDVRATQGSGSGVGTVPSVPTK